MYHSFNQPSIISHLVASNCVLFLAVLEFELRVLHLARQALLSLHRSASPLLCWVFGFHKLFAQAGF
jgi:hypothetical protein